MNKSTRKQCAGKLLANRKAFKNDVIRLDIVNEIWNDIFILH